MENTELGEAKEVGINDPQEAPKRISRRSFLIKSGVVAAGAAAGAVFGLNKLRPGQKEKEAESTPTFGDVVDAVNHAYKSSGQEVPEEILKRLPACNEQTTTQDPVKEVLHSCGEVGGGIRDIIENSKDSETRNRLITDLKTVKRYTMLKIDEYGRGSKLGKLPDPQHIEGFKNMFKETYFTVRPQKP